MLPKKIRLLYIIYWLCIFLGLLFFHFVNKMNADEGVVLNGAWNIINGRRLYLDFFSFIPPASYYFVVAIWKIFGVSYLVAQAASIIVWFFGIFGIFKISQEIYHTNNNYLLPLFLVLASSGYILINHNIYNIVCLIWSVYFLIIALKNKLKPVQQLEVEGSFWRNGFKRNYYLFCLVGLLNGLGFLFLQQKSLVFYLAVNLFLVGFIFFKAGFKNFWKEIVVYNLSVFLPMLILFFWPLKLLFYNLIEFPLFQYLEVNRISYFNLFFFSFIYLVFIWVFRKRKEIEIKILLYLQLFLLISAIPLPDIYHIFQIYFPIFALTPLIFIEISEKKRFLKFFLNFLIIIFIFKIITTAVITLALDSSKASVRSKTWVELVSKNCPEKYIFVGPFFPNFYFETKKLNSTPFDILITGHQTKEQFQLALQSLKKSPPACAILIYPGSLGRFNYSKENLVEAYISDNYNLVESSEDAFFLFRLK